MKKLNTSVVENELTQGSVFFRKSQPDQATDEGSLSLPAQSQTRKKGQISASSVRKTQQRKPDAVRKTERTENRTEKRSVLLPLKRATKRYSFEFFTDQLATLKKLEGQAMMAGKGFNKSDFMRRALDEYFEKVGVELVEPKG